MPRPYSSAPLAARPAASTRDDVASLQSERSNGPKFVVLEPGHSTRIGQHHHCQGRPVGHVHDLFDRSIPGLRGPQAISTAEYGREAEGSLRKSTVLFCDSDLAAAPIV